MFFELTKLLIIFEHDFSNFLLLSNTFLIARIVELRSYFEGNVLSTNDFCCTEEKITSYETIFATKSKPSKRFRKKQRPFQNAFTRWRSLFLKFLEFPPKPKVRLRILCKLINLSLVSNHAPSHF